MLRSLVVAVVETVEVGSIISNPENTGGYGGSGVVIVRYRIAASQMGTAKATGGNISLLTEKQFINLFPLELF